MKEITSAESAIHFQLTGLNRAFSAPGFCVSLSWGVAPGW